MRRITVSVLSIFVVLPAIGGTRLPVVNVGAAGVSARTAFGEGDAKSLTSAAALYGDVPAPAVTAAPMPKKTVVARAAAPVKNTAPVDTGEKIAVADVLMPQRPSTDLWAKSDAPLRMPTADEVRTVRADYNLPEESLDAKLNKNLIARADDAPVRTGALDAEIDRLVELQRRADTSVGAAPVAVKSRRVIAAPVADEKHAPVVARVASRASADNMATNMRDDAVSLRRMVVPMASDDVIVRAVEKNTSPRIAAARDDMASMSPSELRRAFRKTYLSENKHLSTYQVDDRFDVASDMSAGIEGFTAKRDLSEAGGVRPLEIKIKFRGDDSALSRENYNLLTEYAGIVVSNPKRAIQVSIPNRVTTNSDDRKLAARRLAIIEQVLRDTGVSEQRIMPVLSQRDEEGFVLRIISNDLYETLNQQQRDMFGDTTSKKTYKSMSW
ncbi:hypothetical protein HDR61_02015 [bacterium]|nr:hypothetical protein [bacterium]